jgi:pyruvate kinase
MVARGDLGVELPPEDVPLAQKRIIRAANRTGRPVITATQMLESMCQNPRPTRAEASDVANAVIDGTDAVMLSAETAMGDYPVESVAMMSRIVRATEAGDPKSPLARRRERAVDGVEEAVADASCEVARNIGAAAIVALTRTGASAILVSERRPHTPLLAFTPDAATRNRLALVWGVRPYLMPRLSTVDERVRVLDGMLVDAGLAQKGEALVLCMASPKAATGATNIMMVHDVGGAVPSALPDR